jgi:hypothetical protein
MANSFEHGFQFWSNKSLPSNLMTELDVNDELTLTINSVPHTVKIPEGKYETRYNHFSSDLIDAINELLEADGVPVRARLGGIHDDNPRVVLIFETTDLTDSGESVVINSIGGTVAPAVVSDAPLVTVPPKPVVRDVNNDMISTLGIGRSGNSMVSAKVTVRQ